MSRVGATRRRRDGMLGNSPVGDKHDTQIARNISEERRRFAFYRLVKQVFTRNERLGYVGHDQEQQQGRRERRCLTYFANSTFGKLVNSTMPPNLIPKRPQGDMR